MLQGRAGSSKAAAPARSSSSSSSSMKQQQRQQSSAAPRRRSRLLATRGALPPHRSHDHPHSHHPQHQHQHPARDVAARVLGTWRSPQQLLGTRFLDAPTVTLPWPQPQQKEKQQQQQQEEQRRRQQQEQLLQQLAPPPPAAAPDAGALAAEGKKPLRLSWAGSGAYAWWQLGAMGHLSQRFDLSRVPMTGASGGAICAALARCGVGLDEIGESAYALAMEHRVWDRPMGLMGSWGSVIEAWLHDLLPADAAERCRGGLGVIITQLPSCRQVVVSDFADKQDLVSCIMASAHVPLLLDGRATRLCRGVPSVDGSFPDFFTGENCDALTCGGDAVVFDYYMDRRIKRKGRLDMLELKRYSEIRRIALLGKRFAARLEDEGAFDRFDLDPVRRGARQHQHQQHPWPAAAAAAAAGVELELPRAAMDDEPLIVLPGSGAALRGR